MSEVLKQARKAAAEKLETAKADLGAMERRAAEMRSYEDEDRAGWVALIEERQATLDAIDAAIAAEAQVNGELTDVSIDLGDGQTVTLKVSAADAKKLTEARSKRRTSFAGWSEPELKSAVDALEEAIADETPAKRPEPLRIPIEVDTSGLAQAIAEGSKGRVNITFNLDESSLEINGSVDDAERVMRGLGFASGGIARADVEPGLVGERPGETLLFSGYVDRKAVADEVDKKEWSVFGAATTAGDEPFFDLGDCVRVDTKGSGPLSGMSAIGIVVEIGTLGARRTYRVDFPYGFGLEDSFFMAADLTRVKRPDWL